MNWQVGILAFILFWIPMVIIFSILFKRGNQTVQAYKDEMKRINKKYRSKQ